MDAERTIVFGNEYEARLWDAHNSGVLLRMVDRRTSDGVAIVQCEILHEER